MVREKTVLLTEHTTSDETTPEQSTSVDGAYGFNVTGYLRAESGVGEGARLLITALGAAGIPFSTVAYTDTPSRQDHDFKPRGDGRLLFPVNIVGINADVMPTFSARVGPDFFAGRYTIGSWNWETEELPVRARGGLDFVDEVWLSSDYSRDSVRRVTSKPVYTFPLPIIRPEIPTDITRHSMGLPDGYMFLFTFDYHGGFRRKNPVGLVEAFKRAFQPGEGPFLVLKSVNADKEPHEARQLTEAIGGRPDIQVIDGYLPASKKNAILGLCDCYVSLHRSEGFGLTIAEAMSLGKPAIATGYSGNVDFMTEDNSYLVKWTPALVGEDRFFPATGRWSQPDIGDAARVMRHVFEHQDEARARGRRAETDIRVKHRPETRAEFLRGRLHDIIDNRLNRAAVVGTGSEYTYALRRAALLIARGPEIDAATAHKGLYAPIARSWRAAMRRLLRNYYVHQRDVGETLLQAIRELEVKQQAELDELERRLR